MKLLKHLFQFAAYACVVGIVHLKAQSIFWDPAGINNGVGGAGIWGTTSFNTAADSSGTLTASSAATNDFFGGATAGTITVSASETAGSVEFDTSGYTLSVSSGVAFVTGPVTLGTGVTLTLSPSDSVTPTTTLSSVSGGTNLDIGGIATSASTTSLDAMVVYMAASSTISTPIIINATSSSNGGAAGFVVKSSLSTAVTASITAPIANSSGVDTLLGTSTDALASLVVSGVISGTSGVLIENGNGGGGKGTIYLAAQNTYLGPTLLNNGGSGAVTLSVSNALPTTTDLIMGYTATEGSQLNLNGFNQTVSSLMSNGTGNITNSLASTISTLTINGSDTATSAYAQVISNGAGTVALVRAGTGTTTLSGANTYTGGTTVSGGELAVTGSGKIGGATDAVTVSGGVLDFTTTSQTVGAVTLTGGTIQSTGGSGTLTGTSYSVQSGTISAKLAGSGVALTMAGPGTVTLSGANTYTGATTINSGTLLVNGSTAAGSAVAVNSTGILGGTGTVSGAVTVASGGAISPGGVAPGTLTIGSNLTLNGGSAMNFRLGSSSADQLVLNGTGLTLTGPASGQVTINLLNFNGTATLGTYTLLSVTGIVTSSTSWNLSSFNLVADPSLNGSFLSIGGDGFDLQVTAIPEPATNAAIFGAVALSGAIWLRRRRAAAASGPAKS